MIKFIIENHSSKRDANGNTYTYSLITNTQTMKQLYVLDTCEGNLKGILYKYLEDNNSQHTSNNHFHEIYSCEPVVHNIREWERRVKRAEKGTTKNLYEHQITSDELDALCEATKPTTLETPN